MSHFSEDEKQALDLLERDLNHELAGDPDETLSLESFAPNGAGAWKIKIPISLMERWAAVQEDDVHLATLRVYEPDPDDPNPKKKRKCFLFLPPNRDPINAPVNVPSQPSSKARSSRFTPASTAGPISLVHPEVRDWPNFAPHPYHPIDKPYKNLPTTGRDEPDIFELEVYDTELENHIVVASREKKQTRGAPGYHPRARTSMVTARIKTRAFVKRVMSASYRRSLKERNKKAQAPRQLVKPIDLWEAKKAQVTLNTRPSGTSRSPPQSDFVTSKQGKTKERMVRLPRNEILDTLFDLFKKKSRWSIKDLREVTQQPEAYLKQILPVMAFSHQKGEFRYLWELNPDFAAKAQPGVLIKEWESSPSDSANPVNKEEEVEQEVCNDDDDDDDDDDWEEVPTA